LDNDIIGMLKVITFLFILFCYSINGMTQLRIKKLTDLPKKMYETSGLLLYKNEFLITHNDGGNKSEIFILNKKGESVKTIDIEDTKNTDWEDLAQDKEGNVYIGDFGNNNNDREKLQILILEDGFIKKKNVEPKTITFWYEDQDEFPPKKSNLNYDCEAFFEKDGNLYLLTKCRTKPFSGISKLYVIPAKPGKHKAKLIGKFQFCSTSWQFCSVTSVDYNYKTNTLTVLTYGKLYVVSNIKNNEFWKGNVKVYNIPNIKQREAVACAGKNRWYLTDEHKKGFGGGNLYEMYINK